MKRFFFLAGLVILGFVFTAAQKSSIAETDYIQVLNVRAQKIVAELGICDSLKFFRVKNIIVNQYKNLNDIYTERDEQLKNAKIKLPSNDADLKAEITKIEQQSDSKIKTLHPIYLTRLSKELTPQQINQVKDGMTYNVVHVTFTAYNQMILNLTETQKKQIMDWLIEARENAMDAESSQKKHAWFGKYKGRINNYLSAQGYDLKKEGQEWEKRRNSSGNK